MCVCEKRLELPGYNLETTSSLDGKIIVEELLMFGSVPVCVCVCTPRKGTAQGLGLLHLSLCSCDCECVAVSPEMTQGCMLEGL